MLKTTQTGRHLKKIINIRLYKNNTNVQHEKRKKITRVLFHEKKKIP